MMDSQEQKPFVSIIINNYNYGQFIGQAIDSALNQTSGSVEVIVVDDESSDHSREVIQAYGDRILPIFKQNGGQGSALNAGFQASQGDIIFFLDADDYFYPTTVEQVVAHWDKTTVQCQYRLDIVDADGNFIEVYPLPEIPFDSGEVWKLLVSQGRYRTSVTTGTCFHRSALEQVMPIPEADFRISADGYLVAVVPFFGRVSSLDISLGARRVHGSNLWASQSIDQASRLRKSLLHDLLRYQYIDQTAQKVGRVAGWRDEMERKTVVSPSISFLYPVTQKFEYPLEPDVSLRDHTHLTNRIASFRLDRPQHPFPEDSGLNLAWHGFWTTWKRTRLPWKRKVIIGSWFWWVGLMPDGVAKSAIAWLLFNQSRPQIIDQVLKKIRALSR